MPKDLTNGRIYRETVSGVPYGVVDPDDVGPIIGTAATLFDVLCTHPNINPDALFKPYEHPNPGNPNFYTGGDDGKFGYTIPTSTAGITGAAFWDALWAFNPPQTWFNLTEFDGYNHKVHYEDHPWGMTLTETLSDLKCSFNWYRPSSYASEFVSPKSIPLFQNCYPAVAIIRGSSGSGWELRYVKTSPNAVGSTVGALIEIAQSDFDHTIITTGHSLVLFPFLATQNFAPNGTDNPSMSGVTKYSINYKNKQSVYLDNTGPQHGTFRFTPVSLTRPSDNTEQIFLTVRVENITGSSTTGAFYPLYKVYKETTQGGVTYKDLLMDCSVYDGTHPNRNPSQTFALGAYASAEFTLMLGCVEGGSHDFNNRDIDVMDVRIYSPSNQGDSTNFKEMRFSQ